MGGIEAKRDKMQLREDYPEVVSLQDIRTTKHPRKFQATVSAAGKETTAEFSVICNEVRSIMGRKTATELQVPRLGPQINAVSTRNIVDKYKACFGGVGKMTDYQVKIHVNSEVNPVAPHTRRVPCSLREKVERTVQELEQMDIFEKV